MTKQLRSDMYDQLYYEAEVLWNSFNPCNMRNGSCLSMRETGKEQTCCSAARRWDNIEDGTCKDLGANGCTVKSLACKLWACETVHLMYRNSPFIRELGLLQTIAYKYDLSSFRKTKKDLGLN